jgi:hypothetical protein
MVDLHSPSDWIRTIARNAKRLLVFILGVAVLAAGVAMLALPGPGVVVIIVGIVIAALFSTLLVVGVSVAIAGIIGLCTLLPQVQKWIDDKATTPAL